MFDFVFTWSFMHLIQFLVWPYMKIKYLKRKSQMENIIKRNENFETKGPL